MAILKTCKHFKEAYATAIAWYRKTLRCPVRSLVCLPRARLVWHHLPSVTEKKV